MKWCPGVVAALAAVTWATAADRTAPARRDKPQSDPAALAATIDRLIGKVNPLVDATARVCAAFWGRVPVAWR